MMKVNISMNVLNESEFILENSNFSLDYENISLENDTLQLSHNNSYQESYGITNIPAVRVLCYCLYVLIFVTGLCGNSIVCNIVFRNKTMRTVTNLFIVNLSISDIFLSLFATFFTPLYIFMQKWILGVHLCHIIPYAQGLSVYVSSFTLMAIAIDRYFAVIHPFKYNVSVKHCLIIIFIIWLMAGLLTLPYGLFMSLQTWKTGKQYCVEQWPNDLTKKIFVSITTVLQFFIPLIIITFCYIKIFFKLRDRAKRKPGNVSQNAMKEERSCRVNRMLTLMVVVFGISWLPLNIFNITIDFYPPAKKWPEVYTFFTATHVLAMASACYNPLLYAWLNENFKQEFRNVLHTIKCFIACQRHELPLPSNLENHQAINLQPECLRSDPKETITHLKHEEITSVKFNLESDTVHMRKECLPINNEKHLSGI